MNHTETLSKTQKTAKNAIFLYIRMMVVLLINLYSIRLILKALGMEDYGIFNVVAGVVTSLQFVTSVLSTSTQRFYSYTIGKNDTIRLSNIFSVSMNIYFILSLIFLIVCETAGLWLLNNELIIPEDKIFAANCIYQFSIFSFIFTILRIPYSSAVIAHEDMNIYAILSIIDSILKLIIAILLVFIQNSRLIHYGLYLLAISVIISLAYFIICRNKYTECHHIKITDKHLYKEIISFSGWSLFGSTAGIGMNQICTILTNIFFGPIVIASRAIAFQISYAVNSFSSSFLMALRPSMVKSYAEESYIYLNKIFALSNKFIYYCLLVLILPLIYEMNTILHLWLGEATNDTILFSRLILIYTLIMAMNNPISIIIQAAGYVKQYHIYVEIFTLLCVPTTYIFYKIGCPAYSAFIIMIIAAILSHFVRIVCINKYYTHFNLMNYIRFIAQAFVLTVIIAFLIYYVHISLTKGLARLFIVSISTLCITALCSYFIVLNKEERTILSRIIKKKH